ncbi:MAG TPA: apolipoprotein N-acyltransferase [Streptosporangiaceae bacterium]|nr:apolipoprotein N-acyltransferase [Streptosporangiaceae bacterium]
MRSIRTDTRHARELPAQPDAAGQGRPRQGGILSSWWSFAVAVVAGLALAAAFPPVGAWPAAAGGPALLALAVRGKRPLPTLGLGAACGGAFFVALLSWLVNVAWYAWVTLAILETLIFAVLTLALPPLLRLRAWPLAVAGWWVAQEAVRDRFPWGGFPWGRLAMSQPSAPSAGWAAIGGLPWLTFLIALAGGCLAYLAVAALSAARPPGASAPDRRRPVAFAAVLAVLSVVLVLAGNLAWSWRAAPGPSAVVATIQGNVPHSRTLPDQLRATTVTANHAAATLALARQVSEGRRPAPDVVIWPENSTDIDPSASPSTYQRISLAVEAIGRPVLVGAVLSHPVRNAGQLWLPGLGPTQVYIKRQLVPFGEVIPFRGFLEMFTSLPKLQPKNFTPGHRAVVFHLGKVALGDVICYEVGFDNLVHTEVRAGANILAVQTNDADFELDGQQGETLQQLDMSRMVAITTGRSVAVASTIGISAIIAPNGDLLTQSKTWQRAELEARVPLISALTPADRLGSWPEVTIVALTALGLIWALARRRPPGPGDCGSG